MSALLDAKAVAELLGIKPEQVKRRTKLENWPCVRFSSKTIRYRAEHVEQIIALHEAKPDTQTAGLAGQTARSRRRSA